MDAVTLAAANAAAKKNYADRSRLIRARDGALEVWGHSYAFGIGASDIGRRYGALIAQGLGLRELNEAVSGATIASDVSGGSFVKFLQKRPRGSRGAVSGSGVTASGGRGFGAANGVHLLMYGVNDLNVQGNTPAALAPVKQALRLALSRLRAGTVFENTDPSFTFTGTWSTTADTTKNSGADYRYTASATATYTITTPADFPGGTIAIGLSSQSNAGNPSGATHTATVDGTAAGSFTAVQSHAGTSTGYVFRIPNVPAGTHTIAVALSGLTSLTVVDYWQWENPDATAPLCLLLKQPYPPDYSAYGATAPGPPTDAGVDALNAVIDQVAAEFGGRVVVVDTSVMNRDASLFAADKLHPSDKGHAVLAGLVLAAVAAGRWNVQVGSEYGPRRDFGTAAPTDTRTYYLTGDQVINSAPAEAGAAGSMYVTLGWICTAEGRPGTWKPMRVLTGN